jgi:uncharacterized protein YyaL (SSP411 family)
MKESLSEQQATLSSALQTLFTHRRKRVHPFKDDKILTSWNGLVIAALAKGARVFTEPTYRQAAKKAVDFILGKLRTSTGRLLHRYREGDAAIPGFLDDYAYLIWGLIEVYHTTFEVKYLQIALNLNADLIEHFWDRENGGFFYTADDGEALLVRQKTIYDGAIPSGNSVASLNLLRLGRIIANAEFEQQAVKLGRAFARKVTQTPSAHTFLMGAVSFGIGPSYEIIIVGDSRAKDTDAMLNTIWKEFIPNKVVILRPTDDESPKIVQLATYTQAMNSIDGKATAYVCLNYQCQLPTTDINQFRNLLKNN